MAVDSSWGEWWRTFLGFSLDGRAKGLKILHDRYIQESQHIVRLRQHAQRMQYRQFRDSLLAIAADKAKHIEWIAEKINLLGGRMPDVPTITDAEKTSWQYLSEDLNEVERYSMNLLEQAHSLRGELPTVAEVLERIYEDCRRHREILREMLMRSDPQSHLSYLA